MPELYVIGHLNPDMDTIGSAIGYAWLLQQRDGVDAQAARAGGLNPQTTWVLKHLGVDSPPLLTDASPRFEAITHMYDTTSPEQPLHEAWVIANRTGGVAPVVNPDGTPYGLINGWSMFAYLSETIGPHPEQHTQEIADILNAPCKVACDTNVLAFRANARIRDSLHRILRSEDNDFWVVDEQGLYLGICHQREILTPPRIRLVLVDHNEPRQAISALDEAELVEILDHHRLDNPSTHTPIRFTVDVVGSTSTLVSERIEEAGLRPPPEIAGVLLAGLVSDTLVLSSPTTTERDHKAAERLSRWAMVKNSPLASESLQSFGEQVIQAGAGLEARHADEIVNMDTKMYEAGGMRFSISQVEVTKFVGMDEITGRLLDALNTFRDKKGLDFSMLMVTDVVGGSSRLLFSSEAHILNELPYPPKENGMLEAQGVVSRKKQLLPVVLGLLES